MGVSKAMTAFLSGEMRDTVEIVSPSPIGMVDGRLIAQNPAGSWVLERFFSRKDRAKLFRRWPGASSMWVKVGLLPNG